MYTLYYFGCLKWMLVERTRWIFFAFPCYVRKKRLCPKTGHSFSYEQGIVLVSTFKSAMLPTNCQYGEHLMGCIIHTFNVYMSMYDVHMHSAHICYIVYTSSVSIPKRMRACVHALVSINPSGSQKCRWIPNREIERFCLQG